MKRAPCFCPDLSLVARYIYGPGSISWSEWKALRGGGLRQWLAWAFDAGITVEEWQAIEHVRMDERQTCHRWLGGESHWCGKVAV